MVVAAMVALAIGGCRSSGEPLGLLLHGAFVLRTVNGGPLPAEVSTQPTYQVTLLADTLRFDGKELAKRGRTERLQSSTSAPEVVHFSSDYRVRIDGEAIYLYFVCPPNANCTTNGPMAGHLVDTNTLVFGDAQSYVYVRP